MDMTQTIVPRSDQLNADDLMAGPQTITITEVKRGNDEQPVDVVTQEFGPRRPFKPSKSMRRIMVAAWGSEASEYAGRRMTIYRDPSIRFGKDEVGGIRISAMSHIDKPLTVALTVTRGKRAPFTVQPLKDAPVQVASTQPPPAAPTAAEVAASTDVDHLRALYRAASPDVRKQITARVAELQKPSEPEPEPEPDQPQQPETDEFDPWANEEQK